MRDAVSDSSGEENLMKFQLLENGSECQTSIELEPTIRPIAGGDQIIVHHRISVDCGRRIFSAP